MPGRLRNPMVLAGAVLVLLAMGLAWRGLESGGGADGGSRLAGSDDPEFAASGEPSRVRGPSRAQARNKLASLLAIKQGELGFIRLPSGTVESFFPQEKGDDEKRARVRMEVLPDLGRDVLEGILMDGGKLDLAIRQGDSGLTAVGRRMWVAVELVAKIDGATRVRYTGYDENRRANYEMTTAIADGSALLFHSAPPEQEAVLMVVGGIPENPKGE